MNTPQLIIKEDKKSALKLRQQIDVLMLPPRKQNMLMRKIGREVIKKTKKNIKQQKTITAQAMTPRKNKTIKRKMLSKLGRKLILINPRGRVDVTWRSGPAFVADRHQRGISEAMTAAKLQKMRGRPNYKEPATKQQALALKKQGFRRRVNSSKRIATSSWIKNNINMGQAGLILRKMRNAKIKKSWNIEIPARPFLGAKKSQQAHFVQKIAASLIQEIKNK